MPVNDVTLAGGMRGNLANLQLVSMLQNRTTTRLATGLRVNDPSDDPSAFFAAANNRSRAGDLDARKAAMGESIQTVKVANIGITSITALIEQAKGLAADARSANTADRATLATQFDALRTQIDQIANDASYKGINLLSSDSLTVDFNEGGSSSLTVTGVDASATGLTIAVAAAGWASNANIDTAITDLGNALTTIRTDAKTLGSNLNVITTRQDFTNSLINTLTEGADNLTKSDPNEESANMLALQTRQQLGIVALSLSNQAQQSILRLF